MSEEFEAIYENGVLRPVLPVNLPERAIVHLQIVDTAGQAPQLGAADEVAHQHAAMQSLIAWVESQPVDDQADRISASQHDQILYGWQK